MIFSLPSPPKLFLILYNLRPVPPLLSVFFTAKRWKKLSSMFSRSQKQGETMAAKKVQLKTIVHPRETVKFFPTQRLSKSWTRICEFEVKRSDGDTPFFPQQLLKLQSFHVGLKHKNLMTAISLKFPFVNENIKDRELREISGPPYCHENVKKKCKQKTRSDKKELTLKRWGSK